MSVKWRGFKGRKSLRPSQKKCLVLSGENNRSLFPSYTVFTIWLWNNRSESSDMNLSRQKQPRSKQKTSLMFSSTGTDVYPRHIKGDALKNKAMCRLWFFYDSLDIFIFGSNWELLQSWNVTLCMYVCIDFQENRSNVFLLNNIFFIIII